MNIRTVLITAAVFALAACSGGVKEQLGLTRMSPDEFAVVKRAPLTMPPADSSLPRPSPGAPRPQEQATAEQAKQTLFGAPGTEAIQTTGTPAMPGSGEAAFLARAGAKNADPNIRQKVDAETIELNKKNVPVAKKIFGMSGDPDAAPVSVVNAAEEAERLKKNQQQGKPATTGETPTLQK